MSDHGWAESAANHGAWSKETGTGGVDLVALALIESPSTTILAGDGTTLSSNRNYNQASGIGTISTTTPRTLQNWAERHLDTINTLWVDGHVKAVKLNVYVELATDGIHYTHLTAGADPE